jgi:uroporphyrin-III C-methyltransferase/precorrin-2 dehydrogenase/sirohydrochlorin ferrochelatase
MKSFPLFLDVTRRRLVVFGGGEQAAQKLRLTLKTEAAITVVAPELVPEIAAHVASGRVAHRAAVVEPSAFEEVALAFVATGCAGADAAIATIARERGVLVNVVDRPDLCDVTTPAIVDRDPVVVAIGTEGTAPVLARQVKTRIEAMLEPSLGEVAALAGRMRGEVARRVAPEGRRAFWDWFFEAPRRLMAAGRAREAEDAVSGALEAGGAPDARTGFVSLVGAGPGAADMITLRGVQRLQRADVIFHDRLVDPAVLELARRDAERLAVGKAPGGIGWTQGEIDRAIVAAAREGKRVVRLKCGDPGVFGRATEEIAALESAGIDWEIVAGVTAASAAAAEAGFCLTERESIRSVVLTTGQTADDAPLGDWAPLARPGTAVAIYMGVAKAGEIEARLLAEGVPGEVGVEIVENASRPGMRRFSTVLGDLAGTVAREGVRNPAMLLVRWPMGLARSAVVPFPEQGRADAHMRRAKRDRLLEIAAHPH